MRKVPLVLLFLVLPQWGWGSVSLTINPTTVTLANQRVGFTSPPQSFTLSNNGTSGATLSTITVGGTNPGSFGTTTTCGGTLGANANCMITITFTPTTVGTKAGTLVVIDTPDALSVTATLSGVGLNNELAMCGCPAYPNAVECSVSAGQTLPLAFNNPVSLTLQGTGSLSCTTNCTSSTYTAPVISAVPVETSRYGCPLQPEDSIYNTPIVGLPVSSNSANWVSSLGTVKAFFAVAGGLNYGDHTTPTASIHFSNTPALSNLSLAWPSAPKYRQFGQYPGDSAHPHHQDTLNRETCLFTETEGDYQIGQSVYQGTAGDLFSPVGDSSVLPVGPYDAPTASVAGSGVLYLPTLLTSEEIRNGMNHPASFTANAANVYSGAQAGSSFLWPASAGVGSGGGTSPACVGGVSANCPVAGAWLRLTSAWYTANISSYSPLAQNVIRGLRNYGMILEDTGASLTIGVDASVNGDPSAMTVLNEVSTVGGGIPGSAFEVVDVSTLCLHGLGSNCPVSTYNSVRVNPANGTIVPTASASITANDGVNPTISSPIAVTPVTVGVRYPQMTVQAGQLSSGLQLAGWVTGAVSQAITWTSGDATNAGSITAGGLYVPPATLALPRTDSIVATPGANPSTSAVVRIVVLPNTPDRGIRIDTASPSNNSDSQSKVWYQDYATQGSNSYLLNPSLGTDSVWGNLPSADSRIWQTMTNGTGEDTTYGPFMLNNGNYKVTFLPSQGFCSGTWNGAIGTFGNQLTFAGTWYYEANGVTEAVEAGDWIQYFCRTANPITIPAKVSNNVLVVSQRTTGSHISNTQNLGMMNGLSIVPDPTTPFWAIDQQGRNSIPSGGPGYWNCSNVDGKESGGIAGSLQLTLVDWYTGQTNATWSVLSGPGSVDQTGCYIAPLSLGVTQSVVVQATNGVSTTSARFFVIGAGYQQYLTR